MRILWQQKIKTMLTQKTHAEKEVLLEDVNPATENHYKDRELEASIRYAKRIQDGMMLKEKHLQRIFPESFLYLRPRNIVSGDFYWFTRFNTKIVFAVADCTGHGIPGALLSILGISLLNQIVVEERNTDPSLILQRLDHKIHKAFSYTQDSADRADIQNDGLDIGLCTVDYNDKTLEFAGAYRSLYHIRKTKFTEIKGNRYPIGGIELDNKKTYEKERINIEFGDKIYLCTDGYASQFGYASDKKFSSATLKNLLTKTSTLPFSRQKVELERHLCSWMVNKEQTDDILIAGFKV